MVAFTLILTILFSVNWGHTSDGVFAGSDWIGSLIYATVIVMPIIIITDKSLTRTEQARIGVIYIIAFSSSSSGRLTNRQGLPSPSLPTSRLTVVSVTGRCPQLISSPLTRL